MIITRMAEPVRLLKFLDDDEHTNIPSASYRSFISKDDELRGGGLNVQYMSHAYLNAPSVSIAALSIVRRPVHSVTRCIFHLRFHLCKSGRYRLCRGSVSKVGLGLHAMDLFARKGGKC